MNKGLKKAVLCALTTGLMVGAMTGCSKKEEAVDTFDTTKAAVTVGDASASIGVVNLGVRYAQANMEPLYMQYFGLQDPFNTDLFGNGSTLGETTKNDVIDTLSEALLAEQHMADYGVELTDIDKASIDVLAEEFMAENDAEVLGKLHIDKDAVVRYMELNAIKAKVEAEMGADVDTDVSDEEAAQRRVKYALFTTDAEKEDEEAETEQMEAATPEEETEQMEAATPEEETEQMEAATPEEETAALEENDADKTKAENETEAETEEGLDPETAALLALAQEHAEAMITDVLAGGDFDEMAEKYGKTTSEITFGTDYAITQMVEATEGLEDGALVEVPVLSNSNSYYVVQVVSAFDEEATENKKESIVDERRDTQIHELYDTWKADTAVETDAEALAMITFDEYYLMPEFEEAETEVETEVQTEA